MNTSKYGIVNNNAKALANSDTKATDANSVEACTLERTLTISGMEWKTAKAVIDGMSFEELKAFKRHIVKMDLKKVAWQNFRVSMSGYTRIKLKAKELDMTPTELLDYMLDRV